MTNALKYEDGCFDFDKFNFRDYGVMFSQVLMSRLATGLLIVISNTNPPIKIDGEEEPIMIDYNFKFSCDKEDFRELNFMMMGFPLSKDSFVDKLVTLVHNQISVEQELLAREGIPKDAQKVVFFQDIVKLVPWGVNNMLLSTTFKVVRND